MERVIRGRSFTLHKTFYADGVATDPDANPTVTITRSDGTVVPASVVNDEPAAGTWSVTVIASNNLLLDTLTVDWAATVNSISQEYLDTVEVAGAYLFEIHELDAMLVNSTGTYTTAQKVDARTYAETELEGACDIAFVPRFATYRGSGNGTSLFHIPRYGLRAVRRATIGGTALTAAQITDLEVGEGVIYGGSWTSGYGNVIVDYEHGLDAPPPGAREAALVLATQHIVKGPIDDRATQRASEFGPINLATPGMFGSRFGIPVVDAFVASSRIPAVA